jgi:sterol desaturase/sphingolipid hydroxylase (fatty acid hydroxylase superfamily)
MPDRHEASLAYWLDYALFPPAVAAVTVADRASWSWAWLAIAVLGWLTFTYAEYWLHRVVLHRAMWHGHHERHHREPHEYVTFPILAVPLGFAALLAAVWLATGTAAFWVGGALGYLWFIVWHHVLHHLDLARWPAAVRNYATWHLRHHTALSCNYGITVPWWDWLHGTSR